jgi:competence protein ComEC
MTTNAMSCVLRISNGAYTALLAGDIGQAQELQLVQQNVPLRADVLLVPHHGSKTSSSSEFLQAVAPKWALVQSGYRNRYGHPAEPVMRRYQDAGIAVLNSPQCGAMHWKTMDAERLECERTIKLRYWHHRIPG